MKKTYFKVYGKIKGSGTIGDTEYLLGTIWSYGNACIFAESMRASYSDVWIDK